MDGVIVLNKKEGYTSRDMVNLVGKYLHTKKVGHTGTLDPMATGVLLIVVGRATKLVNYLTSAEKEYVAEVLLGIDADTLDITGHILQEEECQKTSDEIKNALASMPKKMEQEVPIYSAVKVNGRKLYDYARAGETVALPTRTVSIPILELVGEPNSIAGHTNFQIHCVVSKGTYIRSLIRDLSLRLQTVGVMKSLVRTRQGAYTLQQANTLEEVEAGTYTLISIREILKNERQVVVTGILEKQIRNGNKLENQWGTKRVVFLASDQTVLALYQEREGMLCVEVMFAIS